MCLANGQHRRWNPIISSHPYLKHTPSADSYYSTSPSPNGLQYRQTPTLTNRMLTANVDAACGCFCVFVLIAGKASLCVYCSGLDSSEAIP